MSTDFTIKIPPVNKTLLIMLGVVLVLSIAALLIIKASLQNGLERRVENAVYKRALKDIDANVKVEHKFQDSLLTVILSYQDWVRQSEIKDSLLRVDLTRSNSRIKQIESGYEKINQRYRGVTNDSLRKLFSK